MKLKTFLTKNKNQTKSQIKKVENYEEDNWEAWHNAAATDTLKDLGPISKEEVDYYKNLK